MRVAVSSADERGLAAGVSAHFGRCPYFTVVDVEDNTIQAVAIVENPHFQDHRPGQVPAFVHDQAANMIVAGGMGGRAIAMFERLSIQAFTGARGTVQDALDLALGGHLDVAAPCAGHSGGGGDCEDHAH